MRPQRKWFHPRPTGFVLFFSSGPQEKKMRMGKKGKTKKKRELHNLTARNIVNNVLAIHQTNQCLFKCERQ